MEILEVLQRPELKSRFSSLKGRDINRILGIISEAEVVEIGKIPTVSRDPKDDKFLATAKAAHADYLVSADKDLLDLKEYQGTRIVDAETFLQILTYTREFTDQEIEEWLQEDRLPKSLSKNIAKKLKSIK